MGTSNIDVGKKSPTRKAGQPIADRLFGGTGFSELRIDPLKSVKAARPNVLGAMAQQRGDNGIHSTPQGLLHLVGCREKPRSPLPKAPAKR